MGLAQYFLGGFLAVAVFATCPVELAEAHTARHVRVVTVVRPFPAPAWWHVPTMSQAMADARARAEADAAGVLYRKVSYRPCAYRACYW
jgi:hypothetical protein